MTRLRTIAVIAFILLVLGFVGVVSALEEPIENIVVREQGYQFQCWKGETSKACAIRALRVELGDVQVMRL